MEVLIIALMCIGFFLGLFFIYKLNQNKSVIIADMNSINNNSFKKENTEKKINREEELNELLQIEKELLLNAMEFQLEIIKDFERFIIKHQIVGVESDEIKQRNRKNETEALVSRVQNQEIKKKQELTQPALFGEIEMESTLVAVAAEEKNISEIQKEIFEEKVKQELNEEEEQRKRALERIQKLRNISFNMNNAETNTEFDSVPAYVRRNIELFGNTLTTVENFYGRVSVEKNDRNETFISTKNSFLDGNRPD